MAINMATISNNEGSVCLSKPCEGCHLSHTALTLSRATNQKEVELKGEEAKTTCVRHRIK